jgi:hypothetical protein
MTPDRTCPRADRLERFLTDRSASPEPSSMVEHVEGCPCCQAWLDRWVEDMAHAPLRAKPGPPALDGIAAPAANPRLRDPGRAEPWPATRTADAWP